MQKAKTVAEMGFTVSTMNYYILIALISTVYSLPYKHSKTEESIRSFGSGAVAGADDVVTGLIEAVSHPIQSAKGFKAAILHPIDTIQEIRTSVKTECTQLGKAECLGKSAFNIASLGTFALGAEAAASIGLAKSISNAGRTVPLMPVNSL